MNETKKQRGGSRPGAGRPVTDLKLRLSLRISKEAHDKISKIRDKSAYIDNLIKQNL